MSGRLVRDENQMIEFARRMRLRAEEAERERDSLRRIAAALDRWAANPEHFWGDTPDTGFDIGAALADYHREFGS